MWYAAVFALFVSAALPAWAEMAGDTARGEKLATAWCADCHLVRADGQDIASDAAPTFTAIANDPAVEDDGLRSFLHDPHYPMPDLTLSRQEVEDFIAYLHTLRR